MSEASHLREQAAKARRLASSVSPRESKLLTDYAEECAAKARELEAGAAPLDGRSPAE